MKNTLILSFLPRIWPILVATIVACLLSLNEWVFQTFGMLLYVPAVSMLATFVAWLIIHLFFRQTIDADAFSGRYLADWQSLTPEERVRYSTAIRIATLLAVAIIAASVGR